jgi:hypothetical protein
MINDAQQNLAKISSTDLTGQLDQMIHSENTQDSVLLNNNSNGAVSPSLTLSSKKKKKRIFDEIQTEDEVKTYNPSDYMYENTVKRLKRPPRQTNRRISDENNTNVNTNANNDNMMDDGSDSSSDDEF